jgi:HK97 family phage portal protein
MKGLFAPLFETRGWANPSTEFLAAFTDGGATTAGVTVNERTALSDPTVFGCVRVLADTVGQLPLKVFRVSPSGRTVDRQHPLYTLLHDLPSPELTPYELKSTLQGHLALWGNAFAEVVRDGLGNIKSLWPLRPDMMQRERDSAGNRVYLYRLPSGELVKWTWSNPARTPSPILHIRGLGGDGWTGYAPLSLLRQSIGLTVAASDYGARLFSNGARPGGVLQTAGTLSPAVRDAMKQSWEAAHRGLTQAHRIAVLEAGVTWQQVGINPDDAQFLETRKFQVAEICRIFRVPPHMVADVERSTSWGTGIEQQQIGFLQYTLMPWLVAWEQALARDLLTLQGWSTHQIRFVVDGLLRADIKTRYEAYQIARQNGVLSADEWRALEDQEPIAGEGGDDYWRPANMVVVGEAPPAPPNPEPPGDTNE